MKEGYPICGRCDLGKMKVCDPHLIPRSAGGLLLNKRGVSELACRYKSCTTGRESATLASNEAYRLKTWIVYETPEGQIEGVPFGSEDKPISCGRIVDSTGRIWASDDEGIIRRTGEMRSPAVSV